MMKASRPLAQRVVTRLRTPLASSLQAPCVSHLSRRYFSSAQSHEYDKVREGSEDAGPEIEYWRAHKDDRVVLDEPIDVVDYWKDHKETHFAAESATSGVAASHRNFSTTKGKTTDRKASLSTDEQKDAGPTIDYWTKHNDTHYTDYWEEHDHSHV